MISPSVFATIGDTLTYHNLLRSGMICNADVRSIQSEVVEGC